MERGGRRLRHASSRKSKHSRGDWGSRRYEDRLDDDNENIRHTDYGIRQRTRSLSPARENSRKAFSKRDYSTELGKREKPPVCDELKQASRNEFRVERGDEIRSANRDNLIQPSLERRQSSINVSREVANPNELRRTYPERYCSSPSYGKEDARNTVTGPFPQLFDHRRDNDFRPGKGHALDDYGMLQNKSIGLEDRTMRPFFTLPPNTSETLERRQSSINVSREDGNYNEVRRTYPERYCSSPSYGKEDARNTVTGALPQLFDHRRDNDFRPVKGHALDEYGMLQNKSIGLEDRTMRPFFTLPPNTSEPPLERRQPSINVSREDGNPTELRRTYPERHCSSLSYGKEDARNTVTGTLPQLFDHRRDNDFRPGKGHALDNYGMSQNKSFGLEDGTVRPFFTLSPNTSEPLHKPKSYFAHDIPESKTGVHYTIENVDSGSPVSVAARYGEGPRYIEAGSTHKFCYGSLSHEEVFEKEERERNVSESIMCPNYLTQSKRSVLDCEASRVPRGFSFDGHTHSLHACQEDFPNGHYDASTSDRKRYRDTHTKENGSVDSIGSLSKDLTPYSRRQMDGTTLMPSERYNKRHHDLCLCCCVDSPLREESWQHGSVRSFSDVHETDWMQNTSNLKSHLKGLENYNLLQNFPVDGYRNMRKSSSLRAISSDLHAEPFSSRSGHLSPFSRMEISRDVPTRRLPEEYTFGKDFAIVKCRETARNYPLDVAVSLPRSNLSLSRSPIRELNVHGSDIQGLKNKYIDEDEDHRHGLKFQEMDLGENQRKYRVGMPRSYKRSERSFHGKSFHKDSHSRLGSVKKSVDHSPESKPQAEITYTSKWSISDWHHDDNYFYEKEEKDFYHPHKFRKLNNEYDGQDRSRSKYHEKDHLLDDRDPVKQPDLPEDSEAFKQQVQRAFLRFAKVLNENLAERKKYEAKGKSESLLCIACGRISKFYVDTHSLVMHAFNSHKFGLRAEHLGLHKALCVLMSWSYSVVPSNGKVYQLMSASDARAMKEDLILWPPLVIIHIPRVEKAEDGSRDAINNLKMDDILKGLGFSGGKSNNIGDSGGYQDIFIVKFSPTLSGLQVAERLHKYCKDNHCGRDDWHQVQSLHRSQQGVGKDTNLLQVEGNAEGIFYGYIGIAADLEEVDLDTKRRSLVKSRKDIEAIADGPVLIP